MDYSSSDDDKSDSEGGKPAAKKVSLGKLNVSHMQTGGSSAAKSTATATSLFGKAMASGSAASSISTSASSTAFNRAPSSSSVAVSSWAGTSSGVAAVSTTTATTGAAPPVVSLKRPAVVPADHRSLRQQQPSGPGLLLPQRPKIKRETQANIDRIADRSFEGASGAATK